MKKLVVKLDLHDDRDKQKALKTVSTLRGIDSIAMDMKERKLTIIGTVDPVNVVSKLRKYWQTDLISVGPAKEPEKKEEPKKEEAKKEDVAKEEAKKEEGGGGKGEPKKEEGGSKEEAKKDEESKPGEGKKDDEGKDDSKKDEPKKGGEPRRPLPLPPPQQFNPYMMDYFAKGYRPPYNPYMNPAPYNPYMNGYNPYMTTHNPYMVSQNPPVTTHYYVQSAEENPSGCTIF